MCMKKQLRHFWHATGMSLGVVLLPGLLMLNPALAHNKHASPSDSGSGIEKAIEFTVKGNIKDDLGSPVPGANILLKGTTMGTTSDANGDYSLVMPDENGTLV